MSAWIVPPGLGLIEPALAPEFFSDRVGAIERLGPNIRIYYCTDQMPLEAGGGPAQRVVTVKMIRPIASVPLVMSQLIQCLIGEPEFAGNIPEGPWPRLVR